MATAGTDATIDKVACCVMVGGMNVDVVAGGVIIGRRTLGLKVVEQGEVAAGLEA